MRQHITLTFLTVLCLQVNIKQSSFLYESGNWNRTPRSIGRAAQLAASQEALSSMSKQVSKFPVWNLFHCL
jgi:hypothetical protein